MGICSGCGRTWTPLRRGMCENDYRRWLKSTKPKRLRVRRPLFERFIEKVQKTETCWLWTASKTGAGYGKILDGNHKLSPAHRVSYELFIGAIPEGYEVDHLCTVKACVNPDHLEAVTPAENKFRGIWSRQHRPVTHCLKGHAYDEANTRWYLDPQARLHRHCRKCESIRTRRRAEERKRLSAVV